MASLEGNDNSKSASDSEGSEEHEITQTQEEKEQQAVAAATAAADQQKQQQQQQKNTVAGDLDQRKMPAKSVSFNKLQLKMKQRQDDRRARVQELKDQQAVLAEKAAAAPTVATVPTTASATITTAKKDPPLSLADSLAQYAKTRLSPKQLKFMNYYKEGVDNIVTPKIPEACFTKEEIKKHLGNQSQKYCIMTHYKNSIQLFHSAFMVKDLLFACWSRTGIDGDCYAQFHISEFTEPMIGLSEWEAFEGTDDDNVIPSTFDLVKIKKPQDLNSFAGRRILNVPEDVAKSVSRPPAIMLVTGKVFYGMVALYCSTGDDQSEDRGYHCSIKEALSYIRFVAMFDAHRVRFDSLLYFILAVYQQLNPAYTELEKVKIDLHPSKEVSIDFQGLKLRFIKYTTNLINEQKKQKILDDRKKKVAAYEDMNQRLEASVESTQPPTDISIPVGDRSSSQQQFPLLDSAWGDGLPESPPSSSATPAGDSSAFDFPDLGTAALPESQSMTASQLLPSSQAAQDPAVVNGAILTMLAELTRENLEQRKIASGIQQEAIKYRREKDERKNNQTNALAGQTEQQRHLLALGLMPLDVLLAARPFAFKDLPFSPTMKKLVETKSQVHILNQIDQHMGEFRCRPNKPLLYQWIKTCGFLPPPGMDLGGCCSFLMIPGFLNTTPEEAALKQSLAIQSEGAKSDADLIQLLGESQIVAPITDDQVFDMFDSLSKFFMILAGNKPCIASTGYAKAAQLINEHGRDIDNLMRDPDEENILLRLCHSVDLEMRFLFQRLFRDILATDTGTYSISYRKIRKRDELIEDIFDGLKRGNTGCLKLPSTVLALVHSKQQQQQQQQQQRSVGRRQVGGLLPPPPKRIKNDNNDGDRKLANTHKPRSDEWSSPEGVANPIATYFPDTAAGNVNKTRVAKITFNHHTTKPGGRDFDQSSLCLPFQFEGFCPLGVHCSDNHRSRTALLRKKHGTKAEAEVKKRVDQLDKLFVAITR